MESMSIFNVKVLPLSDDISHEMSNYFEHGHSYPDVPVEVLNSYPDKIFNTVIDARTKQQLVQGEDTFWISVPGEKENELHELSVNKNCELILIRFTLDVDGQPEKRSERKITLDEVTFHTKGKQH